MDALEALEQFKKTGDVKPVKQFKPTPSIKFSKKGGEFVIGKFLQRRELREGSKAGKSVLDFELIQTNAVFTTKDGDNYTPVSVNPGDEVSLFAPTALDNIMKITPTGTEVYIRCDGKVKEVRNGKAIEYYKFDIRAK